MRLLFFGTPQFAVPTLAALVDAGHEVFRVISQPARPVGRGRKMQDPPVAVWARQRGLEVMQPTKIRGAAFLDELRALTPDVVVVVAYGRIFRRPLLELPRLGCINLHASLLPSYRGAAPIQAALVAGDRTTGVSTMRMSEGLDTGPILLSAEVEIGNEETAAELAPRLAERGAELMVETLEGLEHGAIKPRPQPEEGLSYAPRIEKSIGRVDWSLTSTELFNRLRAYSPWPGLSAELRGKPLKIIWARPCDQATVCDQTTTVCDQTTADVPGTLIGNDGECVLVACGSGTVLALERVQRPGKKAVSGRDLQNGERWRAGERFTVAEVEPFSLSADDGKSSGARTP